MHDNTNISSTLHRYPHTFLAGLHIFIVVWFSSSRIVTEFAKFLQYNHSWATVAFFVSWCYPGGKYWIFYECFFKNCSGRVLAFEIICQQILSSPLFLRRGLLFSHKSSISSLAQKEFSSFYLSVAFLWAFFFGFRRVDEFDVPVLSDFFHFPLLICWSIIGAGAFCWSFTTRSPARFPCQFLLRYLIHGFLFARPFAFTRINVVTLLWHNASRDSVVIFASQTESCFRWQTNSIIPPFWFESYTSRRLRVFKRVHGAHIWHSGCQFCVLKCRDANLWRFKIWRFYPSGLPTPPPSINLPTPPPLLSTPPPKRTHPSPSSSFRIQEYSATIVNLRENRVLMSRIFIG